MHPELLLQSMIAVASRGLARNRSSRTKAEEWGFIEKIKNSGKR